MLQRERRPHVAKGVTTGLMVLALLGGTAGCMASRPALTSTAGDVVSTTEPAQQASDLCAEFGCEP